MYIVVLLVPTLSIRHETLSQLSVITARDKRLSKLKETVNVKINYQSNQPIRAGV